MVMSGRSVLMVVAPVVVVAAPLRAQLTFDAGPTLGYYRPTGHFEAASVHLTSLPLRPADLSGPAWGGEARLWLDRRIGVQLQAATASSTIGEVLTPGGVSPPTRARVLTVTVQGLWNLSPAPERYRFWLGAGTGLVRHGGDAYADHGSPIDVAGVLGVGAAAHVVSRLRVTGGVSALLYTFDLEMPPDLRSNPGSLQRGFQRDVQLHFGLSWGGP